jgi:hypothetical protein
MNRGPENGAQKHQTEDKNPESFESAVYREVGIGYDRDGGEENL